MVCKMACGESTIMVHGKTVGKVQVMSGQVKQRGRKLFLLSAAEQFFYDHAGSAHDPSSELASDGRIRGAVLLAHAEEALKRSGCHAEWEDDIEPWDGDEPYDGPLMVASIIRDDGMILGVLGSVCTNGADDYARVVEAEMALECITSLGGDQS